MNAEELVKNFMTALEAKDYVAADAYLTPEFLFSGWTPEPAWLQHAHRHLTFFTRIICRRTIILSPAPIYALM